MQVIFNPLYKQSKMFCSNKKTYNNVNFKGSLPLDTFAKSNIEGANKVFEFLFASNNIVRYVDNNITAGETLAHRDNNFFKQLFNWGVKTIIDLREFDKIYQKKCKDNGIQYISVPLAHVLKGKKDGIFDYVNNNRIKESFVDEIKTLLNYTKKGNAYLDCQYGVDRTNFALVLDYMLNYDSTHRVPKIFPSNYATRNALRNKNINLVKKIIKKLSQEQRKKLNIPDDFEETILYRRIGQIVKQNYKSMTEKEILSLEKKINYNFME